jgi:hypothetical protein
MACQTVATAYRHLGVVHEYIGALLQSKSDRSYHFLEWHRNSKLAVDTCTKIGELRIRGYARMNIAASSIALHVLESGDQVGHEAISAAQRELGWSRDDLTAVRDERGLGMGLLASGPPLRSHDRHSNGARRDGFISIAVRTRRGSHNRPPLGAARRT